MRDRMKIKKQRIDELSPPRKRVKGVKASHNKQESHNDLLLNSDDIFRFFVENANDIIFSLTPAGILTYVSPNWTEILGHDIHKVVGQPIEDFVHPEDIPLCRAFLERVVATGEKGAGVEYRVRHKTGAWRWHTTNASPVRNADSNIVAYMGIARDITDRKRVEEALRASEGKYRLVFENAGEAIVIDQDGMHKFINRRAIEILGHSEEELTSRPFIEFVHPDDRAMVLERYAKRLNGENVPKVYPLKIIDKDGTVKWIEIHVNLVSWDGKPATLNFFIDITDRKRAKEALRSSELRYQTIFETTGTTMLIVEEDMTISLANDGFESLTGYKREEVEGKRKWTEFVEKDDLEKMVAQHQLRRAESGIAKRGYEFRLVRRDGHMRDIFLTVDLIPGTKRSVASLMDITDRKRAEEALRESEKKYRQLFMNAPAAIYEVDYRKRCFINFNEIIPTITGYSREELMQMDPWKLFTEESKKIYLERMKLMKEGSDVSASQEYGIRKKDGGILWMNTNIDYTIEAGLPVRARIVAHDITERKRLEERLNRAEKMEALGTLAGGVAHDLNNVLGIVVGYSELLLDDIDESSAIRPHVINIMKGGERAAAIVQDLLTLARRGVQTREVINLNTTINEFQKSPEFMKLCSFHPDVHITTHLEKDLLNIIGSPVHLGKTFFNLVSNAVEAMPNGGSVTVRTCNEYLERPIQGYDDVREGDYVVLSVSDTGEGIPQADLKRIFEPFYTKKVMGRSGTGLGLAVVWGTVKDHNGYINVQSKEGKGTTFTLYFPITREETFNGHIPVSVSEYMGNGETILVVDDVDGQRDLATRMLTKLNYTVSNVSSGEAAVEYMKKNQTDIIVLDMIMEPGIDGLETYKKILEINPEQKAIIVSGFSETDRVIHAQSLGAGAYVRKPYVLEKLGMAVRKELDKPQ